MELSLVILALVFVLIAVRQVGRFKFRIWQVMCAGAVAVLLTGQISPEEAIHAVDIQVMVFLLGMFIVGEALAESGYLYALAGSLVAGCRDSSHFIMVFIFSMAFLSAFLMNDTVAIIGTPLALYFGRRMGLDIKTLLLSLCFAVTTGSVASPIGNPQNLLVATGSGFESPFVTFFLYLALPTVLSLFLLVVFIRAYYPAEHARKIEASPDLCVVDKDLTRIVKISLLLVVVCIILQIALAFKPFGIEYTMPLSFIAVAGAAPVVLFSRKRFSLVRNIDWPTLVFFVSLFVLMAAVFSTGFFQQFVPSTASSSVAVLYLTSLVISQFISNVPFVALFNPLLVEAGMSTAETLALAAGSTLAGNLTILGAASNVIVIQNAEKQGETLTFTEFIRIGVPFSIVTGIIFIAWLSFI